MDDRRYLLQRYSDDKESSLGILLLTAPYLFQAYTLEDEARQTKVAGETRIPAKTYELKLLKLVTPLTERYRAKYDWFTWHIEIVGVKGFTRVYIHIGNKDKDSDACVLLGDTANNNMTGDGFIGGSTEAFKRFYLDLVPFLERGRAFIEIRDEAELIKEVA